MSASGRRCKRCGFRLAFDNGSEHCSKCQRALADLLDGPRPAPPGLWEDPELLAALDQRHMGKVVAAYRYHPHHGRAIPQDIVGRWSNLSQSQVSRFESGRPGKQLDRLIFWARLLDIPRNLLWFALPDERATTGDPVRPAPAAPAASAAPQPDSRICSERLAPTSIRLYREEARTSELAASEEVDAVRRRTVIQAVTAMAAAMALPPDQGEGRIRRLEASGRALRRLYHDSPEPADLLALAESQLSETASLRGNVSADDLERVLAVRSEAAILAGRLSFFDLHREAEARGYFGLGYEAAVELGNQALAAAALGHLAFVPARENNVSASIDYLQGAGSHAAQSGIGLLESWVAAVESELTAQIAPKLSLAAIERASELIGKPKAEPIPGWFDYYSPSRLAGFTGFALLRQGRAHEARTVLTAAMGTLEATAVKQRAVFQADIAGTYLADPKHVDVDSACAMALTSVTTLTRAGYAVGADRLRTLQHQLRPWKDHHGVRELDERLEFLHP